MAKTVLQLYINLNEQSWKASLDRLLEFLAVYWGSAFWMRHRELEVLCAEVTGPWAAV